MTFVQRHAYGFGCGLAAIFWPFFRKRRRVSVDNLLRCGVAADEAEAFSQAIGAQVPDAEISLVNGGQPVYYYLISAE